MSRLTKYSHWLIGAAMLALTVALGYGVGQHEFGKLLTLYIPLFTLYLFVSHSSFIIHHSSFTFFLIIAILLRFLLLFSIPNLSNDVYRFIWDGRLLAQGYNPFGHLPLYYLENDIPVKGIGRELFEAFGAKNTYTSYPPVAQAQFASACLLFPNNILGAVVVMKFWLFAFEAGSIFLIVKLLRHFRLPERNVLLYSLNPLIIIEIMGNLHFEGAMVFFLLLALWLLVRSNSGAASAIAFALSICSKLLPFMFLPFLVKRLGWGRSLRYFAVTGATVTLLFLPFLSKDFFQNFGSSLGLYFQKLEFNASLYYLLRWIGFQIKGYNVIADLAPALGVVAMMGILALAFFQKKSQDWSSVLQSWLFAVCIYFLCTTTLHPWYIALPVVLCLFTRWRFPIVWSGLIFLTYVNYSYEPYRENLWVVGAEYAVVIAWFLFEWRTKGKKAVFL